MEEILAKLLVANSKVIQQVNVLNLINNDLNLTKHVYTGQN